MKRKRKNNRNPPPRDVTPKSCVMCGKLKGHTDSFLTNFIRKVDLITSVHVMIPNCASMPMEITSALQVQNLVVKKLPLHALLSPHLIRNYLKSGSFCALSLSDDRESQDKVALLPNGYLCLSLSEEIYSRLGLPGKISRISRGNKTGTGKKYEVRIPLLDESYQVNSKKYRNLLAKIKERMENQLFDFAIRFTPNENSKFTIQTLEARFTAGCYQASLKSARVESQTTCDLHIPRIDWRAVEGAKQPVQYANCNDVQEWLGAELLGLTTPIDESFACSMTCPAPPVQSPHVVHTATRGGLVHPECVLGAVQTLSSLLSTADCKIPYACVTALSPTDSPLSRGTLPACSHLDHAVSPTYYSLIVFPGQRYWLFSNSSP